MMMVVQSGLPTFLDTNQFSTSHLCKTYDPGGWILPRNRSFTGPTGTHGPRKNLSIWERRVAPYGSRGPFGIRSHSNFGWNYPNLTVPTRNPILWNGIPQGFGPTWEFRELTYPTLGQTYLAEKDMLVPRRVKMFFFELVRVSQVQTRSEISDVFSGFHPFLV